MNGQESKSLTISEEPEEYDDSNMMLFLGAEEPMKDLDEEKYRFRRYELKTVEKFTARHFRRFGKRPPGKANMFLAPGVRGLSAVLVAEVDEDQYRKNWDQWMQEEAAEKEKESEKYKMEELRQQQARAQKLTMNPGRICHIMQSEEFLRKTQKPESEMTPFEKIMFDPETLNKFEESLSATNPELLQNLLRIRKGKGARNILPRSFKNKYLPVRLSGPIRLQQPIPSLDRSQTMNSPPKKIKVVWNGMIRDVPEWIRCHLCQDMMRLCMRTSSYRGELRKYPAYRCLRKGCQTFRAIKKIIRDPNEPPGRKYQCQSPDRLLNQSVREYLDAEKARKNKFNGLVQKVVKEEEEDQQDEEDDDELVEWSAYPESSVAAAAEELRDALLNCQSVAHEKKVLEKEQRNESLEDYEYNPFFDDGDDGNEDGFRDIDMIEQKPNSQI